MTTGRRESRAPEFEDYYVIQGGAEGRARLRVLSRVVGPTTDELLARLGVASGWACLDVGCGGGDVALKLATLAHPATVVGIDADGPQLEIARHEAAAVGCANVEFRMVDAMTCDAEIDERFDLVYVRFLLTHLPEPASALAAIVRLAPGRDRRRRGHRRRRSFLLPPVRRSIGSSSGTPPRTVLAAVTRRSARRLLLLLSDAGIEDVAMKVVQPAGFEGDILQIAPLTLRNTRPAHRRARDRHRGRGR